MAYTAKDPCPPPTAFLYLRETKSWWCEEKGGEGRGGEEKVSMLTHATVRGVGKNTLYRYKISKTAIRSKII